VSSRTHALYATWFNICSIYGIRYALTGYFDYRIRNTDAYLKKLNKERDTTIERLKEATKYNSTQQLLEKYGASPKKEEQAPSPSGKNGKGTQKPNQPQGPRTGIAPPPTANIQRPQGPQQQPLTPQKGPVNVSSPQGPSPPHQLTSSDATHADFAPNAFPASLTQQFSAAPATTFTQTHWYDRILDSLLGEDETQAKNRFALICNECRLVNGQAPPGAKGLEDVGRWRCSGCHAWNGREKKREDVVGLVRGWEEERKVKEMEMEKKEVVEDEVESDGESEEEEEEEEQRPLSRNTRSKTKGKGRK
jgi:hypothetical protein